MNAVNLLAAGFSAASQVNLSPVYGAIPASAWHAPLVFTACLAGWAGRAWLQRNSPQKLLSFLPVMAFSIPVAQYALFPFSEALGPACGPAVTEAVCLAPLLVCAAACMGLLWDERGAVEATKPVYAVVLFVFFRYMCSRAAEYMQDTAGQTVLHSRLGFEVVLAAASALLAPSRLLLFAVPALVHTALFNTHVQSYWATQALNSKLAGEGFRLLARQDSITGYISVLESEKEQYRALRCDHSLLGGEWLMGGIDKIVSEPVYAVFAMLEAVRLIEVPVSIPDAEAQALVM